MTHKSRLYTFLNEEKTFSLLVFDANDFFGTYWEKHPHSTPSTKQFLTESILSLHPLINFLKPTEHLGIYLESKDDAHPFQFNLEMFEHGTSRSLITPHSVQTVPSKFTGQCRMVKFLPHQHAPYQSLLSFNQAEYIEIIQQIFSQSYQLDCDLYVNADQFKTIFAYKLPSESQKTAQAWLNEILPKLKPYLEGDIHGVHDTVKFFENIHLQYQSSKVITYHCHCSRSRFQKHLYSLGSAEIHKILREDGNIKVTCDYCQSEYVFTDVDFIWQ